jgi:hypothetical protein
MKVTPQDTLTVAETVRPGGVKGINDELQLSFGATSRFAKGEEVPLLHVLRGAHTVIGFPFTRQHEAQWYVTYAQSLAQEGVPALERMFRTQFASLPRDTEYIQSMDRHISTLLCEADLSVAAVRRAFECAERGQLPPADVLDRMSRVFPSVESKDWMALVARIRRSDSVEQAVAAWCIERPSNRRVVDAILVLPDVLRYSPPPRGELSDGDAAFQQKCDALCRRDISPEHLQLVRLLGGLTRNEIAGAAALLRRETVGEIVRGPWEIVPAECAAPLDSRLMLVTRRIDARKPVTADAICALLPELSADIRRIVLALGKEGLWSVACLSMYSDPLEACAMAREEAERKPVYPMPGAEMLRQHIQRM